jgi:hypothetical protein
MYIGPTMTDVGLVKNTLYRFGKFPAKVQERINSEPGFVSLFVTTDRLVQSLQDLKKSGTAVEQLHKHFAKKFSSNGKRVAVVQPFKRAEVKTRSPRAVPLPKRVVQSYPH